MRFAIARRDVRRIYLLCDGSCAWWRHRLKLARILPGKRSVHELNPDGEGGVASSFFVAESFLLVVADPDSAGE